MLSSSPIIFPFFLFPWKNFMIIFWWLWAWGLGEIFRAIPLVWLVQVLEECANMASSRCFYYLHSPGQHNFTTTCTGATPDDIRRGLYHGVNSEKFSTWYQAAYLLTSSLLRIILRQPATFIFWESKYLKWMLVISYGGKIQKTKRRLFLTRIQVIHW